MYYGKKKIITIVIVVVVLLIVLAIAGFFVFTKTDLFRSDKTLFWKYAGGAFSDIKNINITQLDDIEKLKQQQPYSIDGTLTASSSNDDLNNALEKLKLEIKGQTDNTNSYAYTNTKLKYANNDFFNLEYVNSEDIYALKSDEIVTVFLGIKNENLKVLAQKLGMTSTFEIPNKIEPANYSELLKLSDVELTNINDTYSQLLIESIPDTNYSKQTGAVIKKDGVSYDTTSYRLDLSGEEISGLLVKILNTLKTDSITLNMLVTKAKILNLDEEYTTIDGIVSKIDEIIEKVEETEFTDVSFVVYNYKGETLATEIIIKNVQKTTIFNGAGDLKVIVEDLTGNEDYTSIAMDITYKTTSVLTSFEVTISQDEEQLMTVEVTNSGSVTQGSMQTDINVNAKINGQDDDIELAYTQSLEFVDEIEDMIVLDNTNCAILNDYQQDQLNGLIQAIIDRIQVVLAEKQQFFRETIMSQLNTNNQKTNNSIETDSNTIIDNSNEARNNFYQERLEDQERTDELIDQVDSLF